MRNYTETIKELKGKGINPLFGDFYEFDDFPLAKEFKEFYNYCQEYLDRDDLGFKIAPARFYYNTNTGENAVAYIKNGFSLVEIFKGTIFELHTFYTGKKPVFNTEPLSGYEKVTQRGGVDSSYFLFQYATLFFLYHEVGHLIQRSLGSTDLTEFAAEKCTGDEIVIKHIREHDADWFAAGQLAFHITDFAKRCEPKDEKEFESILSDITAMALAAIYTHFIRWAKGYSKIYYQEYCHPHPSVRLSYIIIYLLDTVAANISVKLDQNSVLKQAIKISEVLMMEPDNNIIEKYSIELFEEIKKVEDYINKIRNDAESYPYLSRKVLVK
ncbi:MAG: hypothetical protein ABI675_14695 [Chitinophagaceae bacterium]